MFSSDSRLCCCNSYLTNYLPTASPVKWMMYLLPTYNTKIGKREKKLKENVRKKIVCVRERRQMRGEKGPGLARPYSPNHVSQVSHALHQLHQEHNRNMHNSLPLVHKTNKTSFTHTLLSLSLPLVHNMYVQASISLTQRDVRNPSFS